MAISAEDLLAPAGPVEPALFPGEGQKDNKVLLARLTSYVNQAYDQISGFTFDPTTKEDDAARAYALYLAFEGAHTLALARPAEEDFQVELMGKVLFSKDQRQGLKELADKFLGDYFSFVEDTGGTTAAATGVPSHQVTNVFVW